jgi:hypothetical protein
MGLRRCRAIAEALAVDLRREYDAVRAVVLTTDSLDGSAQIIGRQVGM